MAILATKKFLSDMTVVFDDASLPRFNQEHVAALDAGIAMCKSIHKSSKGKSKLSGCIIHLEQARQSVSTIAETNRHNEYCDDEHRYEIEHVSASFETIGSLRTVIAFVSNSLNKNNKALSRHSAACKIIRLNEINVALTDIFVRAFDGQPHSIA